MAVPKKRRSRSKRGSRRSHDTVHVPNVIRCPRCHEPVLPHHVCLECGTYKGRTIIGKA